MRYNHQIKLLFFTKLEEEMKSLVSLLGLLFPMCCFAQNVSVPEPEFIGQALYLTSDSTAIPLQKEFGGFSAKTKGATFIPYAGMFAGGMNMYLTVKGNTSPNVIMDTDTDLRLIIRVEDNNMDPEGNIRIMNFEQKKKERRVRFMETKLTGTETNESEAYLTYNAKKYGESCYLITIPESQLLNGCEYGILTSAVGAAGNVNQQPIVTFSYK